MGITLRKLYIHNFRSFSIKGINSKSQSYSETKFPNLFTKFQQKLEPRNNTRVVKGINYGGWVENKKGITKRLIGQNEIYYENHRQSSNFQFIERALSNSSMDFA